MGETVPVVVPVRYSGGGLTMQTTTSRLGTEAAFVRGVVAPKPGAKVTLQLTLPGSPAPVEARGTVTERIPPGTAGKDAGFWLRFEEIDDESRQLLDQLLAARRAPGGASKRAFARVRTHLQVSWPSPREFLVAYAENISAGGIFVATPDPPPLHEIVELSLHLPDGAAPAKTDAEVIQRITADEAKLIGRQAGAGLQFVGSGDDFRHRLDLCIENLLKN